MNFKQGLNEYSDNIPLERWNALQKVIWLELCAIQRWDRNDVTRFMKFAKFFDYFYSINKQFPTPAESLDAILAEDLFVHTAGHSYTIHNEKRNRYSDKKLNKKTDDYKAYQKTLKSGGKIPYLTKVSNIKGLI